MDDERDVEVFERIPWESLEEKPDRRWMAYLLAGAIVLGAVGVSLGGQMSPGSQPVATTRAAVATTVSTEPSPPPTSDAPATSRPDTTWSEADLMALPAESVETSAMALAEWYVVDFFTRDGPEGDRSFVEWARASQIEWATPSSARVTVLVRRLSAPGDEAYQRLQAEAWRVGLEIDDGGWSVAPGLEAGEAPDLAVGDGDGADELTEWVDAAGVPWKIKSASDRSS